MAGKGKIHDDGDRGGDSVSYEPYDAAPEPPARVTAPDRHVVMSKIVYGNITPNQKHFLTTAELMELKKQARFNALVNSGIITIKTGVVK